MVKAIRICKKAGRITLVPLVRTHDYTACRQSIFLEMVNMPFPCRVVSHDGYLRPLTHFEGFSAGHVPGDSVRSESSTISCRGP
eukprot:5574218-Pleurochrysis_carterae.AAC.1